MPIEAIWLVVKAGGSWAMSALKNPIVRYALLAGAAWLFVTHEHSVGVKEGYAKAQAEYATASALAQAGHATRQLEITQTVTAKAQVRADASGVQAKLRDAAVDTAKATSILSPLADKACLDKETTDAIRAIH